ncbi:MAG: flagellar motor protein MotA, partial [Rickettsiales bacterium]|nr:flagellar motor protein MotA [Rickettsiales bacterium]
MAKTRTTDISTLLGIAIAFALVGTAITLGGSASAFIDVPSILIVIGGTFAIVLACFSFREFFRLPGVVFQTIVYTKTEPNKEAQRMLQLAETARAKEGLLGLQNQLNSVNPFLRKGLQLVIDGVEPEKAEL